jgi:hypothetical protein
VSGPKKLVDLNPVFVGYGGPGVSQNGQEVPRREGVGLGFDCPCGCGFQLYVPFENPLDGGPPVERRRDGTGGWQRTGETFETLTLTPSILRGEPCPKRWHGFITSGEIRSC